MPVGPISAPPPFATATRAGLVSATTQTFGGDKTFTGKINVDSILRLAIYPTVSLPVAAGNEGGIVYDTTTNQVKFSDGTTWLASVGSFGIQEEGVTLTGRPALNFIGAGFTAVDNVINSRTDLTLHEASLTQVGVVNLGTQTFGGTKSFQYRIEVNTSNNVGPNIIVNGAATGGARMMFESTHLNGQLGKLSARGRADSGVSIGQISSGESAIQYTDYLAWYSATIAEVDGISPVSFGTARMTLAADGRLRIGDGTQATTGYHLDVRGKSLFTDILGLPKIVTGSLPTASSYEGHIVYDDTTNEVKFSNGSTWLSLSSSGGEVNTASNVGTGSDVFKQKTGVDLEFRRVNAGGGITVTQNASDITIAATGAAGVAIGSSVTSGTVGSLLFVGAGPILSQDNANLFWDDTNNRLGIGSAAPAHRLDVVGTPSDWLMRVRSTDTSGSAGNILIDNPDAGSGHPYITFRKNGVDRGAINGYDTTAFGMRDGISLAAASGKNVNFRIGSTSVGYFDPSGNFLVDTNTLYVDAANNRVGINTTPSFPFHASAATNAKAFLAAGFSSSNPALTVDGVAGKCINLTTGANGGGIVYDDTGSWALVSDAPATIRAGTTGNSGTVRMGFDTSFRYFVGTSFASALFSVATSGNTNQTGSNTSVGFNSGANIALTGDFDILPSADNTGDIGTDALRWRRIRAVSVVTGATLVFDNNIRPVVDYTFEVRKADNATVVASFDTVNGRVGIGTATPTETLTVAGNITATGTISATEITVSSNVLYIGTLKISTGTAAPVSGTWNRGDRVYNTLPVAGGNGGWICVTSGTPGTWKEYELVSE